MSIFLIGSSLLLRDIEWASSSELHTLFEAIATVFAFIVGTIALLRFYTNKNNKFLFIGSAFLCTALLDCFHTVATSDLFSVKLKTEVSVIIPWSWIVSRLFLAVLLWLSLKEGIEPKKRFAEIRVFLGIFSFALLTLSFFWIIHLPYPYYPEYIIHRPQELFALFFFILALFGYLRKGEWKTDHFEHWLVIALILSVADEGLFMIFSARLFDTFFDVAHILKIISYGAVLVGLLISIFNIYKTKESQGRELSKLTGQLKNSLDNEKTVRNVVTNSRLFEEPGKSYSYILEELQHLFKTDINFILKCDEKENLVIINKFSKLNNLNFEKVLILKEEKQNIFNKAVENLVAVNNVNSELESSGFKELLIKNNVNSFLFYPILLNNRDKKEGDRLDSLFVCSIAPRAWQENEKEFFRLFTDAVKMSLNEMRQRINIEKFIEVEDLRNTFIATLTHDLKSPILAEQKALELIIQSHDSKVIDFLEYFNEMYKTNDDLLILINNLLTIYHLESGDRGIQPERNDLNGLIESSVGSLKYLADDNEMQITFEPGEEPLYAIFDRDSIRRVLVNLISNAIKHNSKGVLIKIRAEKTDGHIQVSVSDNGKGIPDEEKQFIFQRYPSGKRGISSGLGLYCAKQIIDAHNQKIWFETVENKGTTFYFTLQPDF